MKTITMDDKCWQALAYAAKISSANYYGPSAEQTREAITIVQQALAGKE